MYSFSELYYLPSRAIIHHAELEMLTMNRAPSIRLRLLTAPAVRDVSIPRAKPLRSDVDQSLLEIEVGGGVGAADRIPKPCAISSTASPAPFRGCG